MESPRRDLGMTDLVTIGLVVFFVALLLVVAALLFLPVVF